MTWPLRSRGAIPVSIVVAASLLFAPICFGQTVSRQEAYQLSPYRKHGLHPLQLPLGALALADIIPRGGTRPTWFVSRRLLLSQSDTGWPIADDRLLASLLIPGEGALVAQVDDSPGGNSESEPVTGEQVGEAQPSEAQSPPPAGESVQVNAEPQPSTEGPPSQLSTEQVPEAAAVPTADTSLPPETPDTTKEDRSWIAKIPWWGWAIAGAVVLGLLASSGGGGGGGGGGKGDDSDSGTVGYSW